MSTTLKFSLDATEFNGKRVLVTGGTKGMGQALVTRLAAGGVRVATTARSAQSKTDGAELFVPTDISTPSGAQKVVTETLASLGGLDILVNSVGGSKAPGGGVLALGDADGQDTLNINLLAAVRLDRGFLPSMLAQQARDHSHFVYPTPLSFV